MEGETMKKKVWVARDKDGRLFCFTKKPTREMEVFRALKDGIFTALPDKLFPDLKWEDEPIKATLQITRRKKKNVCVWRCDIGGNYLPKCQKNNHIVTEDNFWKWDKYCRFCGRKIERR